MTGDQTPMVAGRLLSRFTATAAAVLVVLPAVLAGCGSGSGSTDGAGGAGECPPAPGVTADTIRIGLVYPDSGGGIATGFRATPSAVSARIGAANAAGGVHGRQVVIEWRDDESNPEKFQREAQSLVDDGQGNGVFALLAQSLVASGSFQWLRDNDIPVVGVATDVNWSSYSNVFHFGNIFLPGSITTYGEFVKSRGATKAFLIVDPQAPAARDVLTKFAPSLEHAGVDVVGQSNVTLNISSPKQVAEAVRRSGADALVGAVQGQAFIDIFAELKGMGVDLKASLSAEGYHPEQLADKGQQMAGLTVMIAYATFDEQTPAMQRLMNDMYAYAPELDDRTGEIALAGYTAADLMLLGLERAGPCPTRESFMTNLRQVHDYDGGGLLAGVDLGRLDQPMSCFYFLQVNQAGDRFEMIPGNRPGGDWCGDPIPAAG
ncbi:ABC transporter substrate-binding protein [Frankia sp. CNm7]|uniref:ABC transporter substrate-binding protein n=1 Tax=Frankia nepalensis TaxID=1836974 RepID=A0A937RM58_9ACTN|nr:ABC transporter substrate-binding protein [Frankia nepalensis]MBL7495937.1 ABC transporter substrate-binding protein [Frankia nepalensis]MBL7513590.1 ABC transporter substrate-binding protein [Frankia nepalensis]MBL7524028.1 ABC transporter substrate-binding protein [Frankia nepalensis]MBL7632662.1 ABC transporter substrate-binding protein [Frankia nepalensis]